MVSWCCCNYMPVHAGWRERKKEREREREGEREKNHLRTCSFTFERFYVIGESMLEKLKEIAVPLAEIQVLSYLSFKETLRMPEKIFFLQCLGPCVILVRCCQFQSVSISALFSN